MWFKSHPRNQKAADFDKESAAFLIIEPINLKPGEQEAAVSASCPMFTPERAASLATTMAIIDKAIPNITGVDIGCGMYTANLGAGDIDLERRDEDALLNGFGSEVKSYPNTKVQQRAVDKYGKANYDGVKVNVPKGRKTAIQARAQTRCECVNGFIGLPYLR